MTEPPRATRPCIAPHIAHIAHVERLEGMCLAWGHCEHEIVLRCAFGQRRRRRAGRPVERAAVRATAAASWASGPMMATPWRARVSAV